MEDELKEIERRMSELLEKLFRCDTEDLNFGIYRIMNFKRKEINNFIKKEFVESVEKLSKEQNLSPEVIMEVFNRMYEFFSRYWEDGDFIPKRRYGTNKYYIPYNGEEMMLYWVTRDCYYVKTGELFEKYSFKAGKYTVNFVLKEAVTSVNYEKENKKYFFLHDKEVVKVEGNNVKIFFEYRPLNEEEAKKFGNKEVQEKITELNLKRIGEEIDKGGYSDLKSEFWKKEKEGKELLLLHLQRFVRKNTTDYFIHKDLKTFLSNELDFYIKNEIIRTEEINEMTPENIEKLLIVVKIFKKFADQIIKMLAQIENFQKKMWEKKKFVLRTNYVITLDKLAELTSSNFMEKIIPEILKNDALQQEWKDLGMGEVRNETNIVESGTLNYSSSVKKVYKPLPVDTAYFSPEFKEKLLTTISEKFNLDDVIDGVLIKSENFQALNLILPKYRDRIQTIYIDPPFNKEQDADYLYNVMYKDSTWVTMLENRLRLARDLLKDTGSIFVRCDYNGNWIVRPLMNEIFGMDSFQSEIILRRDIKPAAYIGNETESLFFYSKTNNPYFNKNILKKIERRYIEFHSPGEPKNKEEAYILIDNKKFYPPKGRHWSISKDEIYKLLEKGEIKLKEREYTNILDNKENFIPIRLETEYSLLTNNWSDIHGYGK
ncbi:MAG: DNA methyltransferase, partial [Candidatus Micrarchaeia archaeon]